MAARSSDSTKRLLIDLLEEAFRRKAWHGPNLRGSLRGLTAKEARWRPDEGRKCIWDHAVHAAYWKYCVCRRILGEPRGTFPLPGSNWFPLPANPNENAWRDAVRLLERQHRDLLAAVEKLPAGRLADRAPGSKLTNIFVIRGAAMHDLYHTGQIQLLKRLARS